MPLPGRLQLISLDTNKIKDMVYYRLSQAAEKAAYSAYLHKDAKMDYARQITAEEKHKQKNAAETWVAIRKDNHLLDAECLAHIVVDPEWPGGGVNLVRSKPQPEGLPQKQPSKKIRRVAYERPSWLENR